MASFLEDKVNGFLGMFLKEYDIPFKREAQAGFGSRFDFLIMTDPPICIEVDSIIHEKANEFMHGTIDNFLAYKDNDNFKNKQHHAGDIVLIRIRYDLNYFKFKDLMYEHEAILDRGVGERFKKETDKWAEYNNSKKEWEEKNKESAKKFKKKSYADGAEFRKKIYDEKIKKQKEWLKENKEKG